MDPGEVTKRLRKYGISCHGEMIPRSRFQMTAPDIVFIFVAPPGLLACAQSCDITLSDEKMIDEVISAAVSGARPSPPVPNNHGTLRANLPLASHTSLYHQTACPDHYLDFMDESFACGIFKLPLPRYVLTGYSGGLHAGTSRFSTKAFLEFDSRATRISVGALQKAVGRPSMTLSRLYRFLDGEGTGKRYPGVYICSFCRASHDIRYTRSVSVAEKADPYFTALPSHIKDIGISATEDKMEESLNISQSMFDRVSRAHHAASVLPMVPSNLKRAYRQNRVPTRGRFGVDLTDPQHANSLRALQHFNSKVRPYELQRIAARRERLSKRPRTRSVFSALSRLDANEKEARFSPALSYPRRVIPRETM